MSARALAWAKPMKLVNNMLAATNAVATFETLVMGAKAGLDTQVMLDVINVSSGRNSAALDRVPQCVLPRTFPMRFARSLLYKDVRLWVEEEDWTSSASVIGEQYFAKRQSSTNTFNTDLRCLSEAY